MTYPHDTRRVYTTEEKWNGSDKKWNGSIHFCKETVNFNPFRYGTIGAYGPVAEQIKVQCFFTKMIGTVPLFIAPVPFFLCRVNAPTVLQSLKGQGQVHNSLQSLKFDHFMSLAVFSPAFFRSLSE